MNTEVRAEDERPGIRLTSWPAVDKRVVRYVARLRAVAIGNKYLRVLIADNFAERDMFHIRRPRTIGIDSACDKAHDFLGGEFDRVDVSGIFLRWYQIVVGAIDHPFAVR